MKDWNDNVMMCLYHAPAILQTHGYMYTPNTPFDTWWPVCRQKWSWNWTPSPSYASRNRLCIAGNGIDAAIFRAEHPTMPLPLILQPDMMAGECHPITFPSNSQYPTVDSRWLTWAQRWDPNNQWLLPRAYQPPKITTITTFNGLVLTPSPSSPASTCSAFARWWRTVMFLGL